jgi:hypothetical protein
MLAEDRVAQGEQLADTAVRDAIVDLLAVAACLDEATPAQAAKMGRDATLRRPKRRHQLTDTVFAGGGVQE